MDEVKQLWTKTVTSSGVVFWIFWEHKDIPDKHELIQLDIVWYYSIFPTLILPIQKHGKPFNLLAILHSSFSILKFSLWKSFVSLVRFTPRYYFCSWDWDFPPTQQFHSQHVYFWHIEKGKLVESKISQNQKHKCILFFSKNKKLCLKIACVSIYLLSEVMKLEKRSWERKNLEVWERGGKWRTWRT